MAAAVARGRGGEPLATGPTSADAPLGLEVVFSREHGRYVGTLNVRGSHSGTRRIEDGGPTCSPLADAVVMAITLVLDEAAADRPPASPPPASASPAAAPGAAPSPPETTPFDDELPPAPPSEEAAPPRAWYGPQTLATDGAAVLLAAPTIARLPGGTRDGLTFASIATYGLGGPIVHFAHGHVGKGFLDLGLRIGLPFATGMIGGLIGALAYSPPPKASCASEPICAGLPDATGVDDGIAIGALVGAVGAASFDALVLARERAATDGSRASAVRVQPAFGVLRERGGGGRGTVGLVGEF